MLTRSRHTDLNSLAKEGFLRANPRSHGGIWYYNKLADKIIDFSTNVNPLGPSRKVLSAINQNLKLISSYPDPEGRELRKAISNYVGLDEDHITIGNGANELIHLFTDAFVKKGERVVMPIPTFFEYEFATDKNSGDIAYVECKDFVMKKNTIIDAIDKSTKVIFLCNPNNPSGLLSEKRVVEEIVEYANNNGSIVLLDECFMEFVEEPEKSSLTSAVTKYDNLIVLRTFTKAFGLPGIRVGYCLASKQISRILNKVKVPWNVNALAQKGAVAALADLSHLERTRRLVRKEMKYLQDKIRKIKNFTPYRSDTNFFLVELSNTDSLSVQRKLLTKSILVRECSTFTGMTTNFIRIAVQRRNENRKLAKALEEI